jgi:hypothetical protein
MTITELFARYSDPELEASAPLQSVELTTTGAV